MTTSAAVADTDKAKPTSTASSGAAIISAMTAADSTGIACLRRCVTTASSVMAAITAARNTLADGCTTMTNATKASRGEHDRGPRTDQHRCQQHRPADDRHVRTRTPR